jgi:L-iditol 2-dehydrogenase
MRNFVLKSLLLTKDRNLEIVDLPTPRVDEDEVLILVAACGICGSDVHGYDGSSGRRIPPLIMGHEAAGTIAAIGSGVTGFKVGDRVTFDSTVYCGKCAFCRSGKVNLCDRREVIGVSCAEFRRDGAFAEYIAVPERILYTLPPQMSFPEAAMVEAVSVALHAVGLSGVTGGETAVVIGAGMIGLLAMQAARAAGCARVLIADIDETRLSLARSLGADAVIHGSGSDLTHEIHELTGGVGADLALEAVGRAESVAAAIDAVRKGGTVTLIGNITPTISFPLQNVVSREIRVLGSAASAGEYPQAIELVASGRIQVKPLITAVAPLEDGPTWFDRLYGREPNLTKIVLTATATEPLR